MITKNQIIEVLIAEYPNLTKEYKVKRIGLFGSYAHNSANEQSDIDLIIEFYEPIGLKFIDLCDHLENLFNKKVDVLTPAGLKSIRIQSIKDNILNSIVYVDAA
jgi:predicted nucleotidyltransferase